MVAPSIISNIMDNTHNLTKAKRRNSKGGRDKDKVQNGNGHWFILLQ